MKLDFHLVRPKRPTWQTVLFGILFHVFMAFMALLAAVFFVGWYLTLP